MFETLKRWGRGIGPLPTPKIESVICAELPETVQSSITLLDESQVIVAENLVKPVMKSHQDNIIELTLHPPETVDMLALLNPSGVAGRDYKNPTCKHGLVTYACEFCNKSASNPKEVFDLFDLLLPYLQPSIEAQLRNPDFYFQDLKPHDFQITGIGFLADHPQALLGDEMGLGKTVQTIVALWVLFYHRKIHTALIVCPRALLSNWEEELKVWAPFFYVRRVHGLAKNRETWWKQPASIYLTTYGTLHADMKRNSQIKLGLTNKFQKAAVVLDEAQAIKNPTNKQAKSIHKVTAQYRWGLSGTPMENTVDDLIGIFKYLHPTLFKGKTNLSDNEIKKLYAPYFLRRQADEVLDLPELIETYQWLELTPAQRKRYDHCYKAGREGLKRKGTTFTHVFALINALKQICNYDPQTGQSCKLNFLRQQLKTVTNNNQKALVFSQYPNKTLALLQKDLRQFSPAIYSGNMSGKKKDDLVRRFKTETTPKVLLISIKSGGVGLNLQRASHVFHFDHLWNPAWHKQATARAYRFGQVEMVYCYHLYTKNSIEARIFEILKKKKKLFDVVVDDLSAEYKKGSMDEADLFALFDLPPPR
ncbi:DEAD/DEAH box helicase [Anaerolineales bacterium HSG25]|nr:DEAD/DEAH box helicase [Anaerolineales bacterium HSG25]